MYVRRNESRNATLGGYATILCKLKNSFEEKVVSTYITVDATYTSDWQEDAHCWHDEGWFDYDLEDAELFAPDEYILFLPNGETREGESEIVEIVKIIEAELDEGVV